MAKRKKKKQGLSSLQLQEKIKNHFLKNSKKRYGTKQIIKRLSLTNNYDSVLHALRVLADQGFLYEIKEDRFKVNNRMDLAQASKKLAVHTFIGKVDLTRSGAAYIISPESELDIYVHARNTMGAFSGDIVKVTVPKVPGRRKPEGKITEILERKVTHVMGILRKYHRFATVVPFPHDRSPEVHIRYNEVGDYEDGTAVIAEITDWGRSQNKAIWGKITKVLEQASDNEIAMQGIIYSNGFEIEFPDEVLKEAKDIPSKITQQEIDARRDFRKVTTFTIDPLTAKDFDDALSIEYLENGEMEIGIHIADVTHYVKENSFLDKEALERSTSVYLVDRVVPMLPERLSNDLCSLNPNEDKLVFTAAFKFNKNHKVVGEWFGKSIIHSDKRFVYEEAQEIIDTGEGPFAAELKVLNKVAKKLRKKRFKEGSLSFESDEVYFELDDNAVPIAVKAKTRVDTHMLVEDFMLLANRKVAEFIHRKSKTEIPYVYRIHDAPNMDKLADFALFAKNLGVQIQLDSPQQIAASFNKLHNAAEENPQLKLLEPLAIRTMSKAVYSTENIGHYGLSFDHYSHFTSPIRRYADVLVHRILEKNLDAEYRVKKDNLETKCEYISQQERKANDAERESVKYKQVEFIKKYVGQELDGVVSGMIDRGIFVLLKPSHAEGMVSFTSMNSPYIVDDSRLFATAKRGKKIIKMGDEIKVQVIDADLDMRQIELELIE